AHARKGKAAGVVNVDHLLGSWRCLGEDAEPGKRVDAIVDGDRTLRDGRPADPVKSIAARDEIAGDFAFLAGLRECDARPLALEIVNGGVLGLEQDRAFVSNSSRD